MDENLIFDVGMHKGEDSAFYLKKGFRVVAIEASPELVETATQRFQSAISSGEIRILNTAVAEDDGPITFWVNPAVSVWGTARPDWKLRNERVRRQSLPITVPGRKFTGILEEYGVPYYLKIDIEGLDMLCIEALKRFSSRPRYISVESTQASWNNLLEEFALFKALGYTKFKVVPQHMVHSQTCPNPAREGHYIDYKFEADASGLFGEEAPGKWVGEAEALQIYRHVFTEYRWRGSNSLLRHMRLIPRFIHGSGWYDTHAALG